jgi:hypothetical protein
MNEWYYAAANNQQGPVSEQDLKKLLSEGTINGETLIWKEGMAEWTMLKTTAPEWISTSPSAGPTASAGSQAADTSAAQTDTVGKEASSDLGSAQNLSIAALVCGILGVLSCCCCFLLPLPIAAIILGHVTLNKGKVTPLEPNVKNMAMIGLILGYSGIGLQVLYLILNLTGMIADPEFMQQLQEQIQNMSQQ